MMEIKDSQQAIMDTQRQGRVRWVRGETIGRGSYGFVSLATVSSTTPTSIDDQQLRLPPVMAVKSAELSLSDTLSNECNILRELQDCQHVIRCYGDDLTTEDGDLVYDVLLEYVSGGSLADRIAASPGGLPESQVRCYTRSLLDGLSHIHRHGFVHCDIKPDNLLLSSSSSLKIADFGLAKMVGEKLNSSLRGTPLYISPEAVKFKEYEPQSDIWALGCTVIEMLTGKPAWDLPENGEVCALLYKIGCGHESPKIPQEISEDARSFVEKCLAEDSDSRWTADMLLNHPFLAGTKTMNVLETVDEVTVTVKEEEIPVCEDVIYLTEEATDDEESFEEIELRETCLSPTDVIDLPRPNLPPKGSPCDRIKQLATRIKPDWSFSKDWTTVREAEPPACGKRKKVEGDESSAVRRKRTAAAEPEALKWCFPWAFNKCAMAVCRSIDAVPLGF